MLQFLTKLFGNNNPIDSISNIADKFIRTGEDRDKFKMEMTTLLNNVEMVASQEVTKRHDNDMKSDSWLSKNIRPLTMVFLMSMVTLMAFTDGNVGEFQIKDHYISLYENLLELVCSFYFIGRGAMHIINSYNRKGDKKGDVIETVKNFK